MHTFQIALEAWSLLDMIISRLQASQAIPALTELLQRATECLKRFDTGLTSLSTEAESSYRQSFKTGCASLLELRPGRVDEEAFYKIARETATSLHSFVSNLPMGLAERLEGGVDRASKAGPSSA